eukprot:jgi/Ulvmu1/7478/UM037_0021.1
MGDVSKGALEGHPRYRRVKDLGSGTFGSVVLCDDLRNPPSQVAIKLIPRGPSSVTEYVVSEIRNFRLLLHPHIVQLQEVFLTDQFLGIAMEYANGGDTFDYVVQQKGIHEPQARWLFQQLIIAIDYCHRKGIVNRDLKLENTLLHWHPGRSWPTLKLCDFGYSKNEETQSLAKSRVGTPGYMAPEIVANKPKEGQTYDGKPADLWSAGVILYVMLCARFPFERPDDSQLAYQDKLKKVLQRIVNVQYSFPRACNISESCRDLIQKLLVADPAQRLTIPGIFQHPWFLHDLPQGAITMNDRFVQAKPVGPGFQPLESIEQNLSQATMEVGGDNNH